MRYDEFRDQLQDALHETGLFSKYVDRPTEVIDLASADWRWEVFVYRDAPESVNPFHVSAKISFRWSAANAARGHTCEEDLLTELLGRRMRLPKTQRRWTRVDLELYATLPYGSTTPIPEPQVFKSWTHSVGEKTRQAAHRFPRAPRANRGSYGKPGRGKDRSQMEGRWRSLPRRHFRLRVSAGAGASSLG